MKAIHQFVAGFSKGDAISNEARALRTMFRSWGYESEIYSERHRVLPEFRKEIRDISQYEDHPESLAFLHFSIGSDVNNAFAGFAGPRALLYHNITPHEFFQAVQPQTAHYLEWGREQIKQLRGVAGVNMAVSRFNAEELKAEGFGEIQVLPIVMDFEHLSGKQDPQIRRLYGDGRTNILFVGRLAPNKCIDDLVLIYAHYREHINPTARFIHVGSFAGTETYAGLVRTLARNRGAGHDCVFHGVASQEALLAFYSLADVFLCASEHEGFCIPLLEAMHFDVPILAYEAGAVPETLDGSGVLYREKNIPQVAEMLRRMVTDDSLRSALVDGQRKRLRRFKDQDLEGDLRRYLAPLLK